MNQIIKCEVGILPSKSEKLGIAEVEKILNKTRETIRNLVASGKLKRKLEGKKYIYDWQSLKDYMATFNQDDYYTYAEAKEILKDNGICDFFVTYSSNGAPTQQCVYKRFTKEFPMSVAQLLKRGFLEKEKDIKPILITKKSMIATITRLTNKKPKLPK